MSEILFLYHIVLQASKMDSLGASFKKKKHELKTVTNVLSKEISDLKLRVDDVCAILCKQPEASSLIQVLREFYTIIHAHRLFRQVRRLSKISLRYTTPIISS